MKLNEIKLGSDIRVAELPEDMNLESLEIRELKFIKYITKEDKTYLAEWCREVYVNSIPVIAVYDEKDGRRFIALVDNSDIEFYVNIN